MPFNIKLNHFFSGFYFISNHVSKHTLLKQSGEECLLRWFHNFFQHASSYFQDAFILKTKWNSPLKYMVSSISKIMWRRDDKYFCILITGGCFILYGKWQKMNILKLWLSFFLMLGVLWSTTVASLLFEVAKLPTANKSMKENRASYQFIHLK